MQKLYNPSFSIGKKVIFQRLFHGAIQALGSLVFLGTWFFKVVLCWVFAFWWIVLKGMLLICSLLFTIIHLFLWLVVLPLGTKIPCLPRFFSHWWTTKYIIWKCILSCVYLCLLILPPLVLSSLVFPYIFIEPPHK